MLRPTPSSRAITRALAWASKCICKICRIRRMVCLSVGMLRDKVEETVELELAAPVGVESVEVSGTTQQQRVLQRFFQMAMRAFNGSVLVGDAGVIARGRHLVVAHEPLVALRQILLGRAVEVAERRRQAVAAMLLGNAAERP